MFKFIHAADIHLDSPLRRLERYEGAPVEAMQYATRGALARLVDLALAEQVDLLLIAGDIYDGDWDDYQTGLCFVNQMRRLTAAEIPVVMISGNHDAASVMSRGLRLPENVRVLSAEAAETVEYPDLNAAVHGQSFANRAVTENLAADYPAAVGGMFNIGLLHSSVAGAEGHEPYAPCTVDDLLTKQYDYWALGHVHQRQRLHEEAHIWYSGNLQGRHPRETGAKGCLLVEVDNRRTATVDFRPVDLFRWEHIRVDLTDVEDDAAAAERIEQPFRELVDSHGDLPFAVRCTYHGATPLHERLHADPERWLNQLRADAATLSAGRIWIEKLELRTTVPRELLDELPEDGPVGELRLLLAEYQHDEAALLELATELEPLRSKLPPELRDDAELQFNQPEALQAILADAEPLLLARLQATGEKS